VVTEFVAVCCAKTHNIINNTFVNDDVRDWRSFKMQVVSIIFVWQFIVANNDPFATRYRV